MLILFLVGYFLYKNKVKKLDEFRGKSGWYRLFN